MELFPVDETFGKVKNEDNKTCYMIYSDWKPDLLTIYLGIDLKIFKACLRPNQISQVIKSNDVPFIEQINNLKEALSGKEDYLFSFENSNLKLKWKRWQDDLKLSIMAGEINLNAVVIDDIINSFFNNIQQKMDLKRNIQNLIEENKEATKLLDEFIQKKSEMETFYLTNLNELLNEKKRKIRQLLIEKGEISDNSEEDENFDSIETTKNLVISDDSDIKTDDGNVEANKRKFQFYDSSDEEYDPSFRSKTTKYDFI